MMILTFCVVVDSNCTRLDDAFQVNHVARRFSCSVVVPDYQRDV